MKVFGIFEGCVSKLEEAYHAFNLTTATRRADPDRYINRFV
jgi:hypothetical protein